MKTELEVLDRAGNCTQVQLHHTVVMGAIVFTSWHEKSRSGRILLIETTYGWFKVWGIVASCLVCCSYPWQIHPIARLSASSKNEKSHHTIQPLPSTHPCGQRVWQRCLYQHPHKHTQHLNQPQPDPAPPCQLTKSVLSKWPCWQHSLTDLKAYKPDISPSPIPPLYPRSSTGFFTCWSPNHWLIRLEV